MNESTPPQGSSLLVSVDLTADDQPDGPKLSAPAAKKANLVFNSRVLLVAV